MCVIAGIHSSRIEIDLEVLEKNPDKYVNTYIKNTNLSLTPVYTQCFSHINAFIIEKLQELINKNMLSPYHLIKLQLNRLEFLDTDQLFKATDAFFDEWKNSIHDEKMLHRAKKASQYFSKIAFFHYFAKKKGLEVSVSISEQKKHTIDRFLWAEAIPSLGPWLADKVPQPHVFENLSEKYFSAIDQFIRTSTLPELSNEDLKDLSDIARDTFLFSRLRAECLNRVKIDDSNIYEVLKLSLKERHGKKVEECCYFLINKYPGIFFRWNCSRGLGIELKEFTFVHQNLIRSLNLYIYRVALSEKNIKELHESNIKFSNAQVCILREVSNGKDLNNLKKIFPKVNHLLISIENVDLLKKITKWDKILLLTIWVLDNESYYKNDKKVKSLINRLKSKPEFFLNLHHFEIYNIKESHKSNVYCRSGKIIFSHKYPRLKNLSSLENFFLFAELEPNMLSENLSFEGEISGNILADILLMYPLAERITVCKIKHRDRLFDVIKRENKRDICLQLCESDSEIDEKLKPLKNVSISISPCQRHINQSPPNPKMPLAQSSPNPKRPLAQSFNPGEPASKKARIAREGSQKNAL